MFAGDLRKNLARKRSPLPWDSAPRPYPVGPHHQPPASSQTSGSPPARWRSWIPRRPSSFPPNLPHQGQEAVRSRTTRLISSTPPQDPRIRRGSPMMRQKAGITREAFLERCPRARGGVRYECGWNGNSLGVYEPDPRERERRTRLQSEIHGMILMSNKKTSRTRVGGLLILSRHCT